MNYYIDNTKSNAVELHYEKGGIKFILNATKINNFSISFELFYSVPVKSCKLGDITTVYLTDKVKGINQSISSIFDMMKNDKVSYVLVRNRMDYVINSMDDTNKYFPENMDLLLDAMAKVIINTFFE